MGANRPYVYFDICYHLNSLGVWLHNNGVLGASNIGLIRRPAAYGFCHQHPALSYNIQTVSRGHREY